MSSKNKPPPSKPAARSLNVANIPGWPTEWAQRHLMRSASIIPLLDVAAFTEAFVPDPDTIELHWPWIALAIVRFETKHARGRDSGDLEPVEISKHLRAMKTHADAFLKAWDELDRCMGAAIDNGNIPKAQALVRVNQELLDTFAQWPYTDHRGADKDARHEAAVWRGQLETLADNANSAAEVLPHNPRAKKGVGSRVAGLDQFVSLLAAVWQSMTGRRATAERVEKKNTDVTAPAFVLFVQAAAERAGLADGVTIGRIRTALTPK